jgi:hypothetical protein
MVQMKTGVDTSTKIFIGAVVALIVIIVAALLLVFWALNHASLRGEGYCEKDSDCVPCCGTVGPLGNFTVEGRGECINREFKGRIDACCQCEYAGECNTCRCENNLCVTYPTGDMRC